MKEKTERMIVKRHLALVLMAMFLPVCYALAADIKGKVTDEKSVALAGVTVAVKGKKELYKNTHWDMVDAYDSDTSFIAKVDMKTLPDSLQKKNRTELKNIVKIKNIQRGKIQKDIEAISSKREAYIAAERAKLAVKNNNATLETEIEKIIKQQAKKFNMVIK